MIMRRSWSTAIMYIGLALFIMFWLTACSTVVPVKQRFPEAVPELVKSCPELKQYTGTDRSITELLKIVVENYSTYYECANRVEGWREWYDTQKKIFDEANK